MQKITIDELRRQQGHFSPIYIDTLEEAFQAHPDVPFSEVKLSDSDRLVYESCSYSAGKILAPHENIVATPWFLTSDYIQKKLGCELKLAAELADQFSILDCTSAMVAKMLDWGKKRSPEKLRDYLQKFVFAIAEAEQEVGIDDNVEDWEHNPVIAGKKGVVGYENIPVGMNPDFDWAWTPLEAEIIAFNPVAYHVLGEDEDQINWFDTHPKATQLITKINNSTDIKPIGKKLYEKAYKLTAQEYSVVWTYYNLRKIALQQEINLNPMAQVLINKIKNRTITGSVLYKIQKGQIKLVDPPKEEDWILIWQNYKQFKEEEI